MAVAFLLLVRCMSILDHMYIYASSPFCRVCVSIRSLWLNVHVSAVVIDLCHVYIFSPGLSVLRPLLWFFQVLPSFVHVGSPIPPCWVASLLGPCGLGHRLHSLCRWLCTFRPSLYHSILSGFKSGRTGYGMWCPWRAFGSWTPLIRPLWGLAGSLEVSSFLDIRHR